MAELLWAVPKFYKMRNKGRSDVRSLKQGSAQCSNLHPLNWLAPLVEAPAPTASQRAGVFIEHVDASGSIPVPLDCVYNKMFM